VRRTLKQAALTLVAISALVSIACSNGNGDSNRSPGTVQAYCEASCSQQARCDPDPQPDCAAACESDVAHPENVQSAFFSAYADCIRDLPCTGGDEACLEEAVTRINPNWQDSPLLQACFDRRDACGTFSDDYCIGAIILTPPAQSELADCLELDCGEVGACLAGLV
jgi:hypothetical protein